MILGILLGISLALTFSSLAIIILEKANLLKENFITGAAIGTNQLVNYAFSSLILGLITTLILITILKKRIKFTD